MKLVTGIANHGRITASSILVLIAVYGCAVTIFGWRTVVGTLRGMGIPISMLNEGLWHALAGPAYVLVFAALLLAFALSGKRQPWWLAFMGLPGPLYWPMGASQIDHHHISHELMNSCGGFGDLIVLLSCACGAFFLAYVILERICQKKHPFRWMAASGKMMGTTGASRSHEPEVPCQK